MSNCHYDLPVMFEVIRWRYEYFQLYLFYSTVRKGNIRREVSVVRHGATSLGNWVRTFLAHYVVSKRCPQTAQKRVATCRPEVLSQKSTEVAPKTSEQYRSNDFFCP